MTHNPVGWFEIYVQDMERAKKFYETVFQAGKAQQPRTGDVGLPDGHGPVRGLPMLW